MNRKLAPEHNCCNMLKAEEMLRAKRCQTTVSCSRRNSTLIRIRSINGLVAGYFTVENQIIRLRKVDCRT
jgi:hypothetical protein